MGTNVRMYWILSGFFVFAGLLYTGWSLVDNFHADVAWWEQIEWVGTLGILLSGVLAALIAFYIGLVYKGQHGLELPEDRLDANIDDGEAEQGHFSPWSWWPIVLAGAAAIVVLGLAVGPWISFIGVAILVVSVVGWTYEYYRGYFAR